MSNVIKMPGTRDLPRNRKAAASRMDTVLVTPSAVKAWKDPPFQRPLRVNDKVRHLAEELKGNGGIIPGVLTLGELGRETYLVDGQHRKEAFLMSGLAEGIVDVRICTFVDMAEMGEEFVILQSSLVRMRPDDILRGLEATLQPLVELRKRCPFIGYDQIRRCTNSPVVSMSSAIRCWVGSANEVPAAGGDSVTALARDLTQDDADHMIQFFNSMAAAWGRDQEYWRLWSNINVTIVAWLWRRTVLSQYSQKSVRLTVAQFIECAMSLSADGGYLSWLVGRQLSDRDRSPAYARIKSIFAARVKERTGKPAVFPAPPWSSSHHAPKSVN